MSLVDKWVATGENCQILPPAKPWARPAPQPKTIEHNEGSCASFSDVVEVIAAIENAAPPTGDDLLEALEKMFDSEPNQVRNCDWAILPKPDLTA